MKIYKGKQHPGCMERGFRQRWSRKGVENSCLSVHEFAKRNRNEKKDFKEKSWELGNICINIREI